MKQDSYTDPVDFKLKGYNYGLGLGVEYFATSMFAFDLVISHVATYTTGEIERNDFFSFGIDNTESVRIKNKGMEIRIGMSILFQ